MISFSAIGPKETLLEVRSHPAKTLQSSACGTSETERKQPGIVQTVNKKYRQGGRELHQHWLLIRFLSYHRGSYLS